MLRSLHLRDFVIVDQNHIDFEAGFTVFSGETGAGKSILIDALSLALGGRGDASVVRHQAERAEIIATFEPDQEIRNWLLEHDITTEGTNSSCAASLMLKDAAVLTSMAPHPRSLSSKNWALCSWIFTVNMPIKAC